ncbi:MAG: hypothetical protein Q3980_14810 [Turicibacter sp.]|nr:hypothetical protein [Turicibacter sp.]
MDAYINFNDDITLNQLIEELTKFRDNNNCGELKVELDGYSQPISGIGLVKERETFRGIMPPYINIY